MAMDDHRAARAKRDSKRAQNADRASVQSLLRAIDILELLASKNDGLRLVEVAERAGIPTSTTHRLLTTLEARRFAYLDKNSRCWKVGGQCLSVGGAFGRRRDLAAMALPVMRRLRDQTAQTINLGLADLNKMTLICQTPGQNLPRGIARPGMQAAIASTAMGQCVMAALPDAEVARLFLTFQGTAPTGRLPSEDTLAATIRETRARRFALDDETNEIGLRCVAAAIFDEYSVPIAALSIAGAAQRIEFGRLGEIGRDVLSAAQEITRAIGGRAPAFC
ncbi:IclR family transcriptional regulator [Methylocapsa sp. S129]|uniref:IclR family transcriptional regulator n=1 Tax=Methylocapsa sp. S129 TaxID=1641869 RepID=UPI00131DAA95|nr:IclR family transcriptional regulator [Methylocapsa sp. S129]